MILTVDPGSKKAGVALFEPTGKLMTAWLVEGRDWRETADAVMRTLPISAVNMSAVCIEKMQWYPESPVPVEDLITLSLMAGRVTGLFSGWVGDNTFEYLPRQWKGQVPKDIMIERIKAELLDKETGRLKLPKDKSKAKDVWDAIGIGLYHLRKERRALRGGCAK